MGKVREPSRKSSIEKKEHIIEIGFHMICERGYHHVSTVDIAKKAEVSTGIIYQYFQDKHDILLAGIRKYSDLLYSFFFDVLKEETDLQKEFFSVIEKILEEGIQNYRTTLAIQQELTSLKYRDPEVLYLLQEKEKEVTKALDQLFRERKMQVAHQKEKVHFLVQFIPMFCRDCVLSGSFFYEEAMKKEVLSMVLCLFGECKHCQKLREEA